MHISELAGYAGKRGFGDCKRRPPEHYANMVAVRVARIRANYYVHFWERVIIGGMDECWPWTGCFNEHGYGKLSREGVLTSAHRIAWDLCTGGISKKWILHWCDNPPCCNPWHLHEGDHRMNTDEAMERRRYIQHYGHKRITGSSNPNSVLTDALVIEMRTAFRSGESVKSMSARFGFKRQTISIAVHGRSWKHVPMK